MSDLSKLRAEVEALRDEAQARYDASLKTFGFDDDGALGEATAYAEVLDLIDKHAREA